MNNKEKLYLVKLAEIPGGDEFPPAPTGLRRVALKRKDRENRKLLDEAAMQKLPRRKIPVIDSKLFNSLTGEERNAFRKYQLNAINHPSNRLPAHLAKPPDTSDILPSWDRKIEALNSARRPAVDANATKPPVK